MLSQVQLDLVPVAVKDEARLSAGWEGLNVVNHSFPKWVWLYSNLSIDAGLMDASLDLDGAIVDQDFSGTKGRLGMWGFGSVPRFCVDKLLGAVNEGKEGDATDSDDDVSQKVGICFVNLRLQAHWLKLVSDFLPKRKFLSWLIRGTGN
jgi:hypothetical protein